MAKFINLTPHTINYLGGEVPMEIPSVGVARCQQEYIEQETVDGIQILKTIYGNVEGLPAPQADTYYIVSSLVASAVKNRNDVVVPVLFIRDEQGRILGCKSFARL